MLQLSKGNPSQRYEASFRGVYPPKSLEQVPQLKAKRRGGRNEEGVSPSPAD